MPKAQTILKDDPRFEELHLNFDRLREKGIDHISKLSGEIWTDYNTHDPGITILEVLCYALIDLGFRNQLDIEDILALNPDETGGSDSNFFTPNEILTNNPVTVTDYRKMLLDIEGIRNAWLEPAERGEIPLYVNCEDDVLECVNTDTNHEVKLNGLYNVLLELESNFAESLTDECFDEGVAFDQILNEVKDKLYSRRNLCEDFLDIRILKKEQIGLCADIEPEPDADTEDLLVSIYENIQEFLSPTLPFYTLEELLKKGLPIEEIFEGRPRTKDSHGFIDPAELANLDRKKEIHASDIYRVIMEDERVKSVKNITLFNFLDGVRQTTGEEWCLRLTDGYCPVLAPALSNVRFFKGAIPFNANRKRVEEKFSKRLANSTKVKLTKPYELDKTIPKGQFRPDLGKYPSVQNEFPIVYGIGEGHLSNNASVERRAKALQLKGYLMFYDQLLANYSVQLSNIRRLFSLRPDYHPERGIEVQKTYFSQDVSDAPLIEKLLSFYGQNGDSEAFNQGEAVAYFALDSTEDLPQTAEERDFIIGQLQRLFAAELQIIEAEEKEEDQFAFVVKDPRGRKILESRKTWPDAETAKNEAEILNFLIPLSDTFRRFNNQRKAEYGFEILFKPQNYLDYLAEITENRKTYLKRRDGFLNHLLTRFGEDFTDYVLLMFGVNDGTPDPQEIINDKAEFLSQYPEISHNRGKGIDCRDPEKVWNSDNITGLEKRVTSLMGVPNWERQYLSNFALADREDLWCFRICDHRGNILLESGTPITTCEKAETALEQFCALFESANTQKYECEDIDCLPDCVFGFRFKFECIVGEDRQIIEVIHPAFYATPEKRDEVKECILALISENTLVSTADGTVRGEKNKAKQIGTVQKTESGYRVLISDKNGKKLLESLSVFETEEEAWDEWLRILETAKNPANFEIQTNKTGSGFTFVLTKRNEDGKKEIIAEHPASYAQKSEAEACLQTAIDYFENCGLEYNIEQSESKYGWNLTDSEGNICLSGYQEILNEETDEKEGIYCFFKDPCQSVGAVLKALELTCGDEDLWEKEAENGKFYFYLNLVPEGFRIARSVDYDSPEECDEALKIVKEYMEKIFHGLDKFLPVSFAYRFRVLTYGNRILKGLQLFRKEDDAEEAAEISRQLACSASNWDIKKVEDCCFEVQLLNQCRAPIAVSELFDTYEEAREFYIEAKTEARDGNWHFESERTDFAYGFTIYEHFPAEGAVLLKSHQLYEDRLEAMKAFLKAKESGKVASNYQKFRIQKREYSFRLCDECGVLAVHPKVYNSKKKRKDALTAVIECLKLSGSFLEIPEKEGTWIYELLDECGEIALVSVSDFETETAAVKAFYKMVQCACEIENFLKTEDSGSCRVGFSLCCTDEIVATHPVWYFPPEERDEALQKLHAYIIEKKCDIEILYEEGRYFFQLDWIGCSGACEPVLIGCEYETEEKAKADAVLFWQAVTHASPTAIYELKTQDSDGLYSFRMCIGAGSEVMFAEHPDGFFDRRERNRVLTDLTNYLGSFSQDNKFVKNIFEEESDNQRGSAKCDKAEDFVLTNHGVEIIKNGDKYCFQITFPSLDNSFREQTIKKEYDNLRAALADSTLFWDNIQSSQYSVQCNELPGGGFMVEIWVTVGAGSQLLIQSDMTVASEEDCNPFRQALIAFLNDLPKPPVMPDSKCNDFEKADSPGIGWELIKKDSFVACHPVRYATCEERDKVMADLCEKVPVPGECFNEILLSGELCRKIEDKYYFEIKRETGDTVEILWISAKGYDDRQSCRNAFFESWFTILTLARKKENYHTENCNTDNPTVILKDKKGNPVACIPPELLSAGVCSGLVEIRWRQALEYPIFETEGGYSFGIYNFDWLRYDWVSKDLFETIEVARYAFYCFLKLLPKKHNYRPNGDGTYGFNLGEVLLQSESAYCTTDDAWEGTKPMLTNIQEDYGIFRFTDFEEGCCRSFLGVGADFRYAKHPNRYPIPELREIIRNWLACQAPCQYHSEVCCDTICINDLYYFQIFEKDDNRKNILWQSCEGYVDIKSAKAAFEEQYMTIMQYARDVEFYCLSKDSFGNCCVQLQDEFGKCLAVMPKCPILNTVEERIEAIKERIYHALTFPIFQTKEGFQFQLYDFDFDLDALTADGFELANEKALKSCIEATPEPEPEDDPCSQPNCLEKILDSEEIECEVPRSEDCGCEEQLYIIDQIRDCLTGGRVWESCRTYDTVSEAVCAFNYFFDCLLNVKANFRSEGEAGCGPFELLVTDPTQIYAKHPCCYDSEEELEEAINKTFACLNVEGFHVLEHILIRPRWCREAVWCLELDLAGVMNFLDNSDDKIINLGGFDKVKDLTGFRNNFVNTFMAEIKNFKQNDRNLTIDNFTQSLESKLSGFSGDSLRLFLKVIQIENVFNLTRKDLRNFLTTAQDSGGDNQTYNLLWNPGTIGEPASVKLSYRKFVEPKNVETYFGELCELIWSEINKYETNPDLTHEEIVTAIRNVDMTVSKSGLLTLFELLDLGADNYQNVTTGFLASLKRTVSESTPDVFLPSCPSEICETREDEICPKPDPTEEDLIYEEYIPGADPYSFWATVVLPYWPKRFLNNNFRLFLEETIRKEAPAHVGLHIAWVNPCQMDEFENHLREWLEAKSLGTDCDLRDLQNKLTQSVMDLRNEFPPARLQSPCEDRNTFNPVFLGFSKLA